MRSLRKIKTMLWCYLWAGSVHATRTRVAWQTCCVNKGNGGLGLVESEDAALLVKLMMLAATSGDSNLQYMLTFRLSSYQPYKDGRWASDRYWFTQPSHQKAGGSKQWSRIAEGVESLCQVHHQTKPSKPLRDL